MYGLPTTRQSGLSRQEQFACGRATIRELPVNPVRLKPGLLASALADKVGLMPGGLKMLPQRLLVPFALLSIVAQAQWLSYPDSRTPRTKDGKPNLRAAVPRGAGAPDLSGVWELDPTPLSELKRALPPDFFELQIDVPNASKYMVNLLWDFKPEDDPSRPEAQAL